MKDAETNFLEGLSVGAFHSRKEAQPCPRATEIPLASAFADIDRTPAGVSFGSALALRHAPLAFWE